MNQYFKLLTKNTDIKIEEIKTCKYCWDEFAFTSLEKQLLDKHKFKYPENCSTCTFRMHYSYINDKHLYHRKDTEDWKNLISIFSEDYKWEVLEANKYKKYLLDDFWLKHSKEISKNIFSELKDLYKNFPRASRLLFTNIENVDYASHLWYAKNVYLSYCVFLSEDIYYSFQVVWGCKDLFSSYWISNSQYIDNSWIIVDSFDISYSYNVTNSSRLIFCTNMQDSKDCIFCCNQVNSSYKIFNKQYSKEDYQKAKEDILSKIKDNKEFKNLQKLYNDFLDKNLIEQSTNIQLSEKVVWDNSYYSKNCLNIFWWISLENAVNIMAMWDDWNDVLHNIINTVEWWTRLDNVIWSCSIWDHVSWAYFSHAIVANSQNIYYSIDLETCEECMFCIWLRKKKYHILNKPYEKQEYFKLKEQIISELTKTWKWWEFLWFDISSFPYNDTVAYDFFKVNKVISPDWTEEIIDESAKWEVILKTNDFITDAILDLWWKEKINIKWRTKDKEINIPAWMETIKAEDLPNIDEVDESILKKAIICEETGRPFRIIKQELEYLKKKWLPLPTIHHELRMDKLVSRKPWGQLFLEKCDKCWWEMLSWVTRKDGVKIYCGECYREKMFK